MRLALGTPNLPWEVAFRCARTRPAPSCRQQANSNFSVLLSVTGGCLQLLLASDKIVEAVKKKD